MRFKYITMVLLAYSLSVLIFKFQYILKFLFDFRKLRGIVGDLAFFKLVLCLLLF